METALVNKPTNKKRKAQEKTFFSWPLFFQSLKANWIVWLALTIGLALILSIINILIGSRNLFTKIEMSSVTGYVNDEGMSWLQILGFLEKMGFSLSRIQTMSQIDMNSILNDLVYKICGTLLPIIYIIIVSNNLIASQVDKGSLAYVLSTPTNRRKVIRTQYLFLVASLVAMYLVVTACSMGSEFIGYGIKALPLRTLLYNFSSLCVLIALGGVTFFSSCFFNSSKHSFALGGGFCVVNFLATILGLFGTPVFISVGIGVSAMNTFNYVSLITLFDTDSISNFAKFLANVNDGNVYTLSFAWLIKDAILLFIGFALAFIGGYRFTKKDLPL